MADLLPCPFCGGAPFIGHIYVTHHLSNGDELKGEQRRLRCRECGSEGAQRNTEAEAIAAWNRRAALSRAGKGEG
jgi:Lar family restriction alleviation protein